MRCSPSSGVGYRNPIAANDVRGWLVALGLGESRPSWFLLHLCGGPAPACPSRTTEEVRGRQGPGDPRDPFRHSTVSFNSRSSGSKGVFGADAASVEKSPSIRPEGGLALLAELRETRNLLARRQLQVLAKSVFCLRRPQLSFVGEELNVVLFLAALGRNATRPALYALTPSFPIAPYPSLRRPTRHRRAIPVTRPRGSTS
jgi:hypothetical protein